MLERRELPSKVVDERVAHLVGQASLDDELHGLHALDVPHDDTTNVDAMHAELAGIVDYRCVGEPWREEGREEIEIGFCAVRRSNALTLSSDHLLHAIAKLGGPANSTEPCE